MIAGETTDRAGLLLVQAVATALALRVQSAFANPQQWNREDTSTEPVAFNNRVQEFTPLLELAKASDAKMLALLLVEALDRFAQDVPKPIECACRWNYHLRGLRTCPRTAPKSVPP